MILYFIRHNRITILTDNKKALLNTDIIYLTMKLKSHKLFCSCEIFKLVPALWFNFSTTGNLVVDVPIAPDHTVTIISCNLLIWKDLLNIKQSIRSRNYSNNRVLSHVAHVNQDLCCLLTCLNHIITELLHISR